MLYRITEYSVETAAAFSAGQAYAGCFRRTEFLEQRARLGLDGIVFPQWQERRFHNHLEVYDTFSLGLVDVMDIAHVRSPKEKTAFYVAKDLFLLIVPEEGDERARSAFDHALHHAGKKPTIEKIICGVLEKLTEDSQMILENAEARILEMEAALAEEKIAGDLNPKLFHLKNSLTVRADYYAELADLAGNLGDNENDIFAADTLRFFRITEKRLQRLADHTQQLCESLVRLREAYQAALDYSLNRVMKMFTVVTTVFLPLTLIAGWYGMNFRNMPELSWEFGYPAVILVSALVVLICIWIFKKKKLL